MDKILSWARYPYNAQTAHTVDFPDNIHNALSNINELGCHSTLAYGSGRSYGDVCLAESNHVLSMKKMNKLIDVNWETGVICAQAGITFAELIALVLPRGWFFPVTPGTQFLTLGGAVANDVHGKNHHVTGTFGRHISSLVIYRSDEGMIECSPTKRAELFFATIGGLGLTGIIISVVFQLRPITSSLIEQRRIRFNSLNEFFTISEKYNTAYEYMVAWIDCLAYGKKAGRGICVLGNHAKTGPLEVSPPTKFSLPKNLPFSLINPLSLRAFNNSYYHRQLKKNVSRLVPYHSLLYPLDSLQLWNHLCGKRGFQQYQFVIDKEQAPEIITTILQEISRSSTTSFFAILKLCGDLVSPGLMSFPRPGFSLSLDFPQRAEINQALFRKLDNIVHMAGGRLYPAKDAHMSAEHFKQAYPKWSVVEALRDPKLLSQFWKRVTM
ncbi:FAD-binding protein [Legionella sp. CNM-1927-20]|uniref:FAD-binding protein n=1 Tax=Legionella sp. CNM-1927-20 TaxID=3422221 RepID=UPI00403AC11A